MAKKDKINFPLISIIVPTFGRPTLERTIESIVNSNYPNLEVLVSANNVELIGLKNRLENFPNEVQLVHWSNKKEIPSKAKNEALKYSKGKYVTFLDDDDIALEAKFFKLSEFLQRYKNIFAVFGQYNVRDCYTNEIKNTQCGGTNDVKFYTLLKNNYIASGSIMYRNTSDIWFDEEIEFGEDWMMNLRLISKYQFFHLPIPVYCWTQNRKDGYTATFTKNGIDWRKIVENNRKLAKERWGKGNV